MACYAKEKMTTTSPSVLLPMDLKMKTENKTPYQGNRRTCGYFQCKKCNKHWFSANTWANCSQKCKSCNSDVYPYKQVRHQKSDEPPKEIRPHPQEMCQKCRQLGYFCGSRFNSYGK
ncbi:zinc finger CCHC domain-containing protein 24-like isoform X1 [Penaeus japonicus]|uniref:zinc finger CCHC domain-containing protein 24-like isoform X1 n=2 Tax=Penaeus japonicus TaxID=27405 RepID=UPI001C7112C4|nr:zinc finger CCHC domain-containing protein 24-like isoform X1 [Penaeus japonicus]